MSAVKDSLPIGDRRLGACYLRQRAPAPPKRRTAWSSALAPCISKSARQDRLRRGRSRVPGSPNGQSVEKQESPRRNHRRSKVRTVAGTGL